VSLEAAPDLDVELINGHDVGKLSHLLQGLVLVMENKIFNSVNQALPPAAGSCPSNGK
jgi:hypothetical protein